MAQSTVGSYIAELTSPIPLVSVFGKSSESERDEAVTKSRVAKSQKNATRDINKAEKQNQNNNIAILSDVQGLLSPENGPFLRYSRNTRDGSIVTVIDSDTHQKSTVVQDSIIPDDHDDDDPMLRLDSTGNFLLKDIEEAVAVRTERIKDLPQNPLNSPLTLRSQQQSQTQQRLQQQSPRTGSGQQQYKNHQELFIKIAKSKDARSNGTTPQLSPRRLVGSNQMNIYNQQNHNQQSKSQSQQHQQLPSLLVQSPGSQWQSGQSQSQSQSQDVEFAPVPIIAESATKKLMEVTAEQEKTALELQKKIEQAKTLERRQLLLQNHAKEIGTMQSMFKRNSFQSDIMTQQSSSGPNGVTVESLDDSVTDLQNQNTLNQSQNQNPNSTVGKNASHGTKRVSSNVTFVNKEFSPVMSSTHAANTGRDNKSSGGSNNAGTNQNSSNSNSNSNTQTGKSTKGDSFYQVLNMLGAGTIFENVNRGGPNAGKTGGPGGSGGDSQLSSCKIQSVKALRFFVFGETEQDIDKAYPGPPTSASKPWYQTIGTTEEVLAIWRIYSILDDDNSGRVGVGEFRSFLDKNPDKKISGEIIIQNLLTKKSSFVLADLLKLCWPLAAFNDIKIMRSKIDEYCRHMQRADEPPKLLSQEELSGLIENFRYFDADNSGTVSCHELISSGLLDREQAITFAGGEFEELSLPQFCAFFTPTGYRAHEKSITASSNDGRPLVFEEGFGWRYTTDTAHWRTERDWFSSSDLMGNPNNSTNYNILGPGGPGGAAGVTTVGDDYHHHNDHRDYIDSEEAVLNRNWEKMLSRAK